MTKEFTIRAEEVRKHGYELLARTPCRVSGSAGRPTNNLFSLPSSLVGFKAGLPNHPVARGPLPLF